MKKQRRDYTLGLRLAPEERLELERAAKRDGLDPSVFARRATLLAARAVERAGRDPERGDPERAA